MQEIWKKALAVYGKGPAHCYRIPGIIVTARGTLLAYSETRLKPGDWSARGIALWRSTDEGVSWPPLQQLAAAENGEAVNNPVMIASKNGDVHFLWQKDYHRGFYQRSTDDGLTFSSPVEITEFLAPYRTSGAFQWDVFAFGPGHGIELSDGRLLVPIWMANGGERVHAPSVVSSIVSANGGATWQTGEVIPADSELVSPNETCAAQLRDGSVMFNIRHQGKSHLRGVSISPDGLTGFSPVRFDSQLPDPRCFGGICRYRAFSGEDGLLFSNCAVLPNAENHFTHERLNLTLRYSLDEGATWRWSRRMEAYAGYSDVAVSPDGKWIYCFYEQDVEAEFYSAPHYLTFARVNLEWLSDGEVDTQ